MNRRIYLPPISSKYYTLIIKNVKRKIHSSYFKCLYVFVFPAVCLTTNHMYTAQKYTNTSSKLKNAAFHVIIFMPFNKNQHKCMNQTSVYVCALNTADAKPTSNYYFVFISFCFTLCVVISSFQI